MVCAGQLQPKGGLMAQDDRLGPEVSGHLALWAAFISPRPCNDSVSRVVLRRVRNCRSYYYYYYYYYHVPRKIGGTGRTDGVQHIMWPGPLNRAA